MAVSYMKLVLHVDFASLGHEPLGHEGFHTLGMRPWIMVVLAEMGPKAFFKGLMSSRLDVLPGLPPRAQM